MRFLPAVLPVVGVTLLSGVLVATLCFLNSGFSLAWILLGALIAAIVQYKQLSKWAQAEQAQRSKAVALLKKTNAGASPVLLDDKNSELSTLLSEIEKAVVEALRKERTAIDNAVDVICVIDTNGKILSANTAAKSGWGYSPDQLVGRSITEFILAETAEETLNPFIGAEKSIERIIVENRLKRKNGVVIDLLWSAHWSASDGGLFCVAHDITERKRTERMLEESEKRIRTILESVPAGIAIINKMGIFEFMNKTSYDLTGYDPDSSTELRASDLFPFAKDPFIPASFFEAATEETKILTKFGERIPCELSVREFNWNDSPGILVIFMDLADKYAVEQAKREFLAMVSHDLRGPLTSINSVLGLLSEGHLGELTEAGRRLSSKTLKQSLRLVQMINELLDLEKMRSGRFVFRLEEASVLQLAKEAMEVVERTASAQGINLVLEGDDLSCVCDGARVIQVFVNLLDNSLKFSEPGSHVKIDVQSNESGGCIASVCNYGRLIPAEKLKSIFEKFEQARPGAAQERRGTGLGLAICKSIVEEHGERIWAESSEAEGTRFRFTLGTAGLKASSDDDSKEELSNQVVEFK